MKPAALNGVLWIWDQNRTKSVAGNAFEVFHFGSLGMNQTVSQFDGGSIDLYSHSLIVYVGH